MSRPGLLLAILVMATSLACAPTARASDAPFAVLKPDAFKHYDDAFNSDEAEAVVNAIPNAKAWPWIAANAPLFECPDEDVQRIYYFRWWTYRKHIVQTPGGFVLTEFITPVSHAGAYNTISCAVGHHLREGRWLRDPKLLDDYTRFWFRGGEGGPSTGSGHGTPQPHAHKYSSWLPAAAYDRFLVTGDDRILIDLLDDFVADYQAWERERQLPDGLFWQYDVADGMEESISGSRRAKNARPTINAYMYGNARAISAIATRAGRTELAREYAAKADALANLVTSKLWDDRAKFFKVRLEDGEFSDAREAVGFVPWYFNLPPDDRRFAEAWSQLTDEHGFWRPWGLTTAEQRHPAFMARVRGKCEWDGPVWPFATSQTLTALGNLLNGYQQHSMTRDVYFDALKTYAKSQQKDGKSYIREYQHPETGAWLKGDNPRSRFYNHSTFCDLVINDLVGLRPRADDRVEVNPLMPPEKWSWFCLDGVPYHGHALTIVWDRDGTRYSRGRGLTVLADGRPIARRDDLGRLDGRLK
jgi:hypothetical protein